MSNLVNPYAVSILGKPLAPAPVPQLRAEGAPMSRAQLDMARWVFGRFMEQARLSFDPSPSQHGFLPDGSRFRIVSALGAQIMQVWPVVEEIKEDKELAPSAGILVATNAGAEKRFFVIAYVDIGKGTPEFVVRETKKGYCGSIPVVRGEYPKIEYFTTNIGMYNNPETPESLVKYGPKTISGDIYYSQGNSSTQIKYATSSMKQGYKYINLDNKGLRVTAITLDQYNEKVYVYKGGANGIHEIIAEGKLDINYSPIGRRFVDESVKRLKNGDFLITERHAKIPIVGYDYRYAPISNQLASITQMEEYALSSIPIKDATPNDAEAYFRLHLIGSSYDNSNGIQALNDSVDVIDNSKSERTIRITYNGDSEIIDTITSRRNINYHITEKIDHQVPGSVCYGVPYIVRPAGEYTRRIEYEKQVLLRTQSEQHEVTLSDSIFIGRYIDKSGELYDAKLITEVVAENKITNFRKDLHAGYSTAENYGNPNPVHNKLANELSLRENVDYSFDDSSNNWKSDWTKVNNIETSHLIKLSLGDDEIILLSSSICVEGIWEKESAYPPHKVNGSCIVRIPIGFEPATKTVCFIECEKISNGFEDVYLKDFLGVEFLSRTQKKMMLNVSVRFTIYRGSEEIYSKDLFTYEDSEYVTSGFVKNLDNDYSDYSAADPPYSALISKKEFIVEQPAPTYVRHNIVVSWTGDCKTSIQTAEEYTPSLLPGKDGLMRIPIKFWKDIVLENTIYSTTNSIPKYSALDEPTFNHFRERIPVEYIDEAKTEVWFGIDPNSFCLAVVCKHAKLLITPTGKVHELSSVLPTGSGDIKEWCAST